MFRNIHPLDFGSNENVSMIYFPLKVKTQNDSKSGTLPGAGRFGGPFSAKFVPRHVARRLY